MLRIFSASTILCASIATSSGCVVEVPSDMLMETQDAGGEDGTNEGGFAPGYFETGPMVHRDFGPAEDGNGQALQNPADPVPVRDSSSVASNGANSLDGGASPGNADPNAGMAPDPDVQDAPVPGPEDPPEQNTGSDGPIPCTCKNPADECMPQNGGGREPDLICARRNTPCNLVQNCPEPYICRRARCVCSDPFLCGSGCNADADCPDLYEDHVEVCHVATNTCRKDLKTCFYDSMCEPGEVCDPDRDRTCNPAGAGAAHTECASHDDCASRLCNSAICLTRCSTNGDCPGDLRCIKASGYGLACVHPANSGCNDCGEPNQFCIGSSCRVGDECETSTDCVGDCLGSEISNVLNFVCSDGPRRCEPSEFLLLDGRVPEYCFLPQACEFEQDCPAEYSCFAQHASIEDFTMERHIGLCARRLPE